MEKILVVKEARLRDIETQVRQLLLLIEKQIEALRHGSGQQLTQAHRDAQLAALARAKQLYAEAKQMSTRRPNHQGRGGKR